MTTKRGLAAIIGGTGVELRAASLQIGRDEIVRTRWGEALVTRAELNGRELIFLHRHADVATGNRHVPPHRINYRANIAALKMLGVTSIFASTAVGSLRRDWSPGTLVLLDQFIDGTSSRAKTFFDERAVHVDFSEPYCQHARGCLLRAASELGLALQPSGTYFCADGPRFETPAEIRAYAQMGGEVVGMTGVPEAVLAREASISYAGVSIVTNFAAGLLPQPLRQAEVVDAMKISLPQVLQLFLRAAQNYEDDPHCAARRATDEFKTSDFDPASLII